MASITLKKIPARLHRDFKSRARANHRSLQAEIVRTLEEAIGHSEGDGAVEVDAVAGMLKPKRRGLTIEGIKSALDADIRRQWKKSLLLLPA